MEADGAVDPVALERELRAAVAADERRERENAAKLRALRQRVPSYEEFRLAGQGWALPAGSIRPWDNPVLGCLWSSSFGSTNLGSSDLAVSMLSAPGDCERGLMGSKPGDLSPHPWRNIVLASHLKPLEKKDKMGKRNILWNPYAAHAKTPQGSDMEILQELDQLPRTSAEFYRDWRRCLKSGKEKYQLLLELGGEALGRIFQADLGFGLLGEFLTVLAENVCPQDGDAILQILQSLSGTKRFGLNVDLLSELEKESSRDLFRKLQRMRWNDGTARHPRGRAGCEAEREAHLMDISLEKEERILLELMECYQVS
ncbi:coiled-coil domain-containing protein 103 isoform X1 [Cuculus canorus]|nr:coiled-coil domain-containing protein 103 isoform X1 [Cuculus canorus]